VHQILEGTNEIMRLLVSRALLGNSAAWPTSNSTAAVLPASSP
jgi:hypothetical protein